MLFIKMPENILFMVFHRTGSTYMNTELINQVPGLKLFQIKKHEVPQQLVVIYRDPWERFRSWYRAFQMVEQDRNIWNAHAPKTSDDDWFEYFAASMHYDGHTQLQYFCFLNNMKNLGKLPKDFHIKYLNTKNLSEYFGQLPYNNNDDLYCEFSTPHKERIQKIYNIDYKWIDSFGDDIITL